MLFARACSATNVKAKCVGAVRTVLRGKAVGESVKRQVFLSVETEFLCNTVGNRMLRFCDGSAVGFCGGVVRGGELGASFKLSSVRQPYL